MELEPARAEVDCLVLGALDRLGAGAGVHAPEGDQDVVVPRRPGNEVRDAVGLVLELGPGVDGEDDGGHVQFAVDLGDPVQRRAAVLGLEVLGGGLGQGRRKGLVAVAVHFEVDVHVDRIE